MSNLKKFREAKGLSQSQLASKSGIGIKVIQSYEQQSRDINKASGATLYKLSVTLDVKIEDLLNLSEIKKEVGE